MEKQCLCFLTMDVIWTAAYIPAVLPASMIAAPPWCEPKLALPSLRLSYQVSHHRELEYWGVGPCDFGSYVSICS